MEKSLLEIMQERDSEYAKLKRVEEAAKWFLENPDSPNSAYTHIKEALESA